MTMTPQPGIVLQMMEASQTCRELMGVLVEENQNVTKPSGGDFGPQAEARLNLKKRLSIRLEKLLSEIKAQKSSWRGDRQAENVAVRLAEEIEVFRSLASQNEMMLRAAHQLRADIISVIRDTLEASQPRVTTYSANGTVQNGSSGGVNVVGTTV